MGTITDINKISVTPKNQVTYEGEKIGKWWGKTLYQFKDGALEYETFSPITLLLHLFGYKKEFNSGNLTKYLDSKIKIRDLTKQDQVTEKTALQALGMIRSKKKDFDLLCQNRQEDSIIQLFKDGLDVNTVLDVGVTVLHEACLCGFSKVAQYLIENGADVNARALEEARPTSKTPLQAALECGYDEIAELLLEKGADVNATDRDDNTVLHDAIKKLSSGAINSESSIPKKLIQALLKKGADVNAPGFRGYRPLYLACERGDLEVAEWLIDAGAKVNAPVIFRTPLARVCEMGKLESAKWLVSKGADVNLYGERGEPPLLHAIREGHLPVVQFLLENRANPRLELLEERPIQEMWEAPLVLAVLSSSKKADPQTVNEMVRLLIQSGADVDQVGRLGETALHYAAEQGNVEAVKLLFNAGAKGFSSNLHTIVKLGDLEAVKRGLQSGAAAYLYIKDLDGKTPLDLAREKGHSDIAAYLATLIEK